MGSKDAARGRRRLYTLPLPRQIQRPRQYVSIFFSACVASVLYLLLLLISFLSDFVEPVVTIWFLQIFVVVLTITLRFLSHRVDQSIDPAIINLLRKARSYTLQLDRRGKLRKRAVKDHCWLPLFDFASQGLSPVHVFYIATYLGPRPGGAKVLALAKLFPYRAANFDIVNNHLVQDSKYSWDFLRRSFSYLGNEQVQSAFDTAFSVNATSLGDSAAREYHKKASKDAVVVDFALTHTQRLEVSRIVNFPLLFTGTEILSSDHAVLAALRRVVRVIYDRTAHPGTTLVPTLVVGSAFREINAYAQSHLDYYLPGVETKDYLRTVLPLLNATAKSIKSSHRSIGKYFSKRGTPQATAPMYVKAFARIHNIIDEFKAQVGSCAGFFLSPDDLPNKYERLLFEDSAYEFGPREWRDIFIRTGAKSAVGYGLYPKELLFPMSAPDRNYVYEYNKATGKSTVVFRNGVSNGYTHRHDTWASFLSEPVMNFPEFSLCFEITSRIGPYLTFTVTKTTASNATTVRRFELEEREQFCQIRDLFQEGKTKVYFPVLVEEWLNALNWALSQDIKAIDFATVHNYVRRMARGASLVKTELASPWHLPRHDWQRFTLAVVAETRRKHIQISGVLDGYCPPKFIGNVRKLTSQLAFAPFKLMDHAASYFVMRGETDLVIYPDNFITTRISTPIVRTKSPEEAFKMIASFITDEDPNCGCAFCDSLKGTLGKQLLKCNYQGSLQTVDVSMTTGDLDQFWTDLIDDDEDPIGLKTLKEKVKPAIPRSGFSKAVRFEYLMGGPGCGKSFLIRARATISDMIYAPFTKLKADYLKVPDPTDGTLRDLRFATTHRGLLQPTCRAMYIDEFTSLSWDYIRLAVYITNPEVVYIVGDIGQTTVREGVEGRYIGNYVDVASLPRHTLLRNFRNGKDVVAYLNKQFGYEMEAMSSVDKSMNICTRLPLDVAEGATDLFFTHATAENHGVSAKSSEKYTVRANQGGTFDNVILHLKESDLEVARVHGMWVVAVSRHKSTLQILHDGSQAVLDFLEEVGLPAEGQYDYDNATLKTWTAEQLLPAASGAGMSQAASKFYENLEEYPEDKVVRRTFLELSWAQIAIFVGLPIALLSRRFSILYGPVLLLLASRITLRPFNTLPFRFIAVWFHWSWMSYVHTLLFSGVRVVSFGVVEPIPFTSLLELVFGRSFVEFCNAVVIRAQTYHSVEWSWLLDFLPRWYPVVVVTSYYSYSGYAWALFGLLRPTASIFTSSSMPHMMVVIATYLYYRSRSDRPVFVFHGHAKTSLTLTSLWSSTLYIQLGSTDFRIFDNLKLSKFSDMKLTHLYYEMATEWLRGYRRVHHTFQPESDLEEALPAPRVLSGRDAFRMADEDLPASCFEHVGEPLNLAHTVSSGNSATNGKIDLEDHNNPKNRHGNFVQKFVYAWTSGIGNTFSPNSPGQTLNVVLGRYLNPKAKPKKAPGGDAQLLCDRIVKRFIQRNINSPKFSEDLLEQVVTEAEKAAQDKKYSQQLRGYDNPDARSIRMHLKAIFKPAKLGGLNVEKPGQGISAWSKDSQVIFGTAIRYINAVFSESLKANVCYDNRMSQQTLITRLRSACADIPLAARNGVTDFEMYDAQQDEFTQMLEKTFLRCFGITEDFITHYYYFRSRYPISAGAIHGYAGTEKTSGEPGTLFFNSIINALLLDYILDGEGPYALAIKGDDGYKRQVNLKIVDSRLNEVQQWTKLKMKAGFEDPAEFCGCVIGRGTMVVNIPRRHRSILGRQFSGYKNFCDYRVSLLQWIKDIYVSDEIRDETLAMNAELYYSGNMDMATRTLEEIVSISHLNEAQFYEKFTASPVPLVTSTTVDPAGNVHSGLQASAAVGSHLSDALEKDVKLLALSHSNKLITTADARRTLKTLVPSMHLERAIALFERTSHSPNANATEDEIAVAASIAQVESVEGAALRKSERAKLSAEAMLARYTKPRDETKFYIGGHGDVLDRAPNLSYAVPSLAVRASGHHKFAPRRLAPFFTEKKSREEVQAKKDPMSVLVRPAVLSVSDLARHVERVRQANTPRPFHHSTLKAPSVGVEDRLGVIA